jgi:hypothetical protein
MPTAAEILVEMSGLLSATASAHLIASSQRIANPETDVTEIWTVQPGTSETWTPIPTTPEIWTTQTDTSEIWTPITTTPEGWTPQ